ncbi:hypothetical protein [Flavobacterium granuli]|uniref:Lipoprotein n=1 Tax=Flavobacterium granuli TaxID=280093 RepID=A0ABU1RXP0_9FLAO|nr:hypothetical protein [Flavobacterium granuli]MDR6843531.1 hypothetical protein [Flavobacterium granuli]
MKTTKLIFVIFCITCITLTSCSSNEDEIPQTGEPFWRANSLQFYYSNDTNTDLLDLNNNPIFPVTYEESYIPSDLPPITNPLRYNYKGGIIEYESKMQKYYWSTLIAGKQGYQNNRIFVRISEKDTDTIDVKFKFKREAMNGSNGIYAYIDKLYYNRTLILEENSKPDASIEHNKRVYIQKKGNKTVILK